LAIGRETFIPRESKRDAGTVPFLVHRCGNFCDPGMVTEGIGRDYERA
jgi:hypothetical protein